MERCSSFLSALLFSEVNDKMAIDSENEKQTGAACCGTIFLTESSKSPASIAKSNKQWVGTCLYQEWYKPLLISCEAAIRL